MLWAGRSYADAPMSMAWSTSPPATWSRATWSCEILAADGYDLVARPEAEPAPRRRRPRPKARKKPGGSPFTILN